MPKISPFDRTTYCQAHLADVTLISTHPEERQTVITILYQENNITIETSDPQAFERLIQRCIVYPKECWLTYVWAPSGYPINHCTIARFTVSRRNLIDHTFGTKEHASTDEQGTTLAERMSTLQAKLTD